MNTSSFRKILLGSAFAALTASPAFAILPFAKGELFVTAEADAMYDTNIYSNNLGVDDYVFTVTPGVAYVRNAGLLKLNVDGGVQIQRFADYNEHDGENGRFSFQATTTDVEGKTDGQLNVKVQRNAYANADINDRTVVDVYGANGTVGHWVTEKLGFRFRADASEERSVNGLYADLRRQTASGAFRYLATPKLETYFAYTFRHSATANDPFATKPLRANDHRISVGAEGELGGKVTCGTEVGYVTRDLKRNGVEDSKNSPFAKVTLDFAATEKTSFRVEANKDFDVSAASQSVNRFDMTVSATQTFTPKFSATASASYMHANYDSAVYRSDDLYLGQLSFNVKFTETLSASAYASFSETNSSVAFSEYTRNTLGLMVKARF